MAQIENLSVDLKVIIGATHMPLSQFLKLGRGGIIALDTNTSSDDPFAVGNDPLDAPLKVQVNGHDIASAHVVVRGEDIGVELIED